MLRSRFLVLLLVLAILPVLVLLASGRNEAAATHGGSPSPELTVVGQLPVGLASFGLDGSVSDVWAFGDYAYVSSFDEPVCTLDTTGVHIVDISSPSSPTQVGFIPSPPNTRANDVKVEHIDTRFFEGEILVHSNEFCGNGFIPRVTAAGGALAPGNDGVAIYDVTNPLKPRVLKQNYLNFQVHNTFIYQQGDNAYMLVVDDESLLDVHIIDITRPWSPREIAVTGAPDWPTLETLAFGASFVHDVWVQENGGQVTAYLSYWDSGLVLLDITDPANPVFLGDSQYIDPDPLSGQPPEGNSHVAAPTADGNIVIMGDEDFSPSFIDTFTHDGVSYPAAEANFTTQITSLPGDEFSGPLYWTGGEGCTVGSIPTAPSADAIALIQRGSCRFDLKASNAIAQGYAGMVVANQPAGARGDGSDGDVLVTMSGDPRNIVGIFVGHSSGEAMKAQSAGSTMFAHATFDGWGYMRVLDVTNPGSIVELGQFATEGVLSDLPPALGDRTMHNVIVDGTRAYISWYADGMRVVDFSGCSAGGGQNSCTPTEIAHFVDGGGSNFWGVFLHEIDNTQYILGSDRDSGLWIFETP